MENSTKQVNILGTEKIGTLLAKFALPGIASLVINALYNIVDQIFIGRGVGYLGNAATNVVFPLTTFAMAFALMIGDGSASFMSLMLGKKENEKAARGTTAGLIFTVVAGIAIAALYMIFLEPLCRVFGATDSSIEYAMDYGRIIVAGIPFCAVCAGYASIIRADGSPLYNMVGLLTGCFLNLVGDPVFIFVLGMGVKGAAWATIIGQIANALINFAYIARMKSVRLEKKYVASSYKNLGAIFKLGLSSFISQMVLVVIMAVQNNYLRSAGAASVYGPDIPLAALGVTMKVFNILIVIIIGLASGAQPIWGYNYGAKQYGRVKEAFRIVLGITIAVMCVALVLFQTFPMTIVSIFGADDEIYNQFAVKTLRIFLMLIPFAGFQLAVGIFFQAVGKPVQASMISLSKQIVFQVPATIILANLMGVEGILWSGPVSDVLAFALTLVLLFASWNKIFPKSFDLPGKMANKYGNDSDEDSLHASRNRNTINGVPLVVTIGRSYGSKGRVVGKAVAEKLGIPYYDVELINEAAEESGLSAMFIAFAEETNLSGKSVAGIAAGASNSQLDYIQKATEEAQSAVIEKVAANGSCVIVGRRADQILEETTSLLKVFVTMPFEKRVEVVMSQENLSGAEAKHEIKLKDKIRADYYNLTKPDMWGNSENYDLCVDVGITGIENASDLIVSAAKMKTDKISRLGHL